jgi:hypothetical protein
MNTWYTGIYKALILAGMISFLISFFSSGVNSYGSVLSGYVTLTLGILMILVILINNILKTEASNSFYQIITSLGPFLLMLAVLVFLLYLVSYYKNIIVENNAAPYYYKFTNIGILLFFLQTYIILTNLNSHKFLLTGNLPTITNRLLYLLCILNLFSSWVIYINLRYYTTDGFQ